MCALAIMMLVIHLVSCMPTVDAEGVSADRQILDFREGGGEQYADVRPGSDTTVEFPVTVDGEYFRTKDISKIICKFDAELAQRFYSGKTTSAPGWKYKIEPDTIELGPNEKKDIVVEVYVPEETSYYSVGELRISGTATTVPGNEVYDLNEIDGIIRIIYYDEWKLTCSKIARTLTKGDIAVFEVMLHNMGNGNDIFFQSVSNDNKLMKKDIKLEYPVNVDLDEKSVTKFDVIVTTSDKTPKGDYVIEFCSKPTDINNDEDKVGNYLYCLQFIITVEPDTFEQLMIPSVVIFIILVIIVFVKIVRRNDKKSSNEH
jgi:hypothetical protein